MKSTLTKTLIGACAIALCAPLALAEPGDGDGKGKGPRGGSDRPGGDRPERPSREEMMKKFDKDGDGKLSDDERVAMIKERLGKDERFKEMFIKRADTDKDGKLSDEEIKVAAKKFGQRGRRGGGDRPDRGGDRPDRGGEDGPGKGKKRPQAEL